MGKFRKRPVVIEAICYSGANLADVMAFMGEDISVQDADIGLPVFINTMEGTMSAMPGDFIIKGVRGEFYPCKPDIFAATYEPAELTGEKGND
jgi:hypothetical protein